MRGCLVRAFRFCRRASGERNGRARNPTIRPPPGPVVDQTESQIVWGMILRDHAPQDGRHPVWISSCHRLYEISVCI